jgi:hypothetical protein
MTVWVITSYHWDASTVEAVCASLDLAQAWVLVNVLVNVSGKGHWTEDNLAFQTDSRTYQIDECKVLGT